AYARSHDLSEGQARAITFAGTWGSWQGFGWAEVFDIGTGDDGISDRVAVTVAAGLAGITTGALIARKPISAGTATTVNFGGLWGSLFGIAGGVLAGLEDDDLLAATLVGGNAGLVTTAILAPRWQMSRNRARLVSIAGVLGGVAGAGILLLTQPDDERIAITIPLAGSIAGLAIGAATTRDYDQGGAAGGDGPEGNALLEWRGGRPRLGTPLPLPGLVRAGDGPRAPWRPAARLMLFRARF
ncbi:MAG: hypothetical protein ACRELX_03170, partial [Longimicrobiales bacterium]